MIKAVLFDFDGVITTDGTGTESICRYISDAAGIDRQLFETEYRKFNYDLLTGKTTHREIWPKLCSAIGMDIPFRLLHESFINTPMDNGIIKLIKEIKNSGYKTGIVTNNKTDRIDIISDHFKMEDYFDEIIISAEIGSGKNEQRIFYLILKKLSVSPKEVIFIDNSRNNLEVPGRMGLHCILFNHEKRDINKLIDNLKLKGTEINFYKRNC